MADGPLLARPEGTEPAPRMPLSACASCCCCSARASAGGKGAPQPRVGGARRTSCAWNKLEGHCPQLHRRQACSRTQHRQLGTEPHKATGNPGAPATRPACSCWLSRGGYSSARLQHHKGMKHARSVLRLLGGLPRPCTCFKRRSNWAAHGPPKPHPASPSDGSAQAQGRPRSTHRSSCS